MANENDVKRFTKSFVEVLCAIKHSQPLGEESRKFLVLSNIHDYEVQNGRQITISDISKISGMAVPNVSRFLRPLEESGYIERQRIGRTVYLHVTTDGDQVLAAKFKEISDILRVTLDGLSEEKIEIYLKCGEKICTALKTIAKPNNETGDKNV
ncbi:MAG: winged helix-turn-helix transcriptional regulator [Clostridia bacterium]|nr:winged helix-turn-helix transcriptional regulator [Clostridia bacterium]